MMASLFLKLVVKKGWSLPNIKYRPAGMKSEPGPPLTLGNAAAARVRLIVWCKGCQRQVEPDPAEMAAQYGAQTPMFDWRERLVYSHCGSRQPAWW
jgi:hypothetical protein